MSRGLPSEMCAGQHGVSASVRRSAQSLAFRDRDRGLPDYVRRMNTASRSRVALVASYAAARAAPLTRKGSALPSVMNTAGREALGTAKEGLWRGPEPRSGGRDWPCGDPGRRGGHRAGVRDHGVPGRWPPDEPDVGRAEIRNLLRRHASVHQKWGYSSKRRGAKC